MEIILTRSEAMPPRRSMLDLLTDLPIMPRSLDDWAADRKAISRRARRVGSLTLPSSGDVYVDTQILIYTVERHPTYGPLLQSLWQTARSGAISIVSSELALMETLVRPIKVNDITLQTAYESALLGTEVRLLPITQSVLREAARLRAIIPSLRTPDALHAATALVFGSSLVITNDQGFRRIPGLPLAVLDDHLDSVIRIHTADHLKFTCPSFAVNHHAHRH